MNILHPLRTGPVALLWAGLSLSAVGDQLYAVALTWIAVQVFGPEGAYLTALQAGAALAAVLAVGKWADLWEQRRGMIGADLGRAAVLLAVVGLWLGSGGPAAAPLVSAIVALAIGQAVFQPALQTVLPPLVADKALLPAANGLLDATDRSARLVGPGLVALLAGTLPIVHFLSLDAASFLASAFALALIGRLRPGLPATRRADPETLSASLHRGVRAMREHPVLGYALSTTAVINGTWYVSYYLALPLLIARRGDGGIGGYGLVLSAYGCTNLLSTLVCGSRRLPERPQNQMFGGSLIVGAGIAGLALASLLPPTWQLPGYVAAAALGAIGGPMKDIPMAVLRQTCLRPGDMAAAMRAYMAANSAGMLVALLLAPSLIGVAGVMPVILGCAAAYGVVSILGLVRLADWRESGVPGVG